MRRTIILARYLINGEIMTKSPGKGESIPLINQSGEEKVGGAVRLSVPEEKYVFRW